MKNSGLGFAIPYIHSGTGHDYMPDFIARFVGTKDRFAIFETKGHDDRLAEKRTAADRWVDAINRDGRFGFWSYALLQDRARIAEEIRAELARLAGTASSTVPLAT